MPSRRGCIKPWQATVIAVVCIATPFGCDGGAHHPPPKTVEHSLRDYLEKLPPESSGNDIAGPITKVTCRKLKATYKGMRVSLCYVTHKSGTVGIWCAVQIRGKLYTGQDQGVPCLRS